MPMTEAQDLAWIADRVPGEPRYIRQLWEGKLAMPAPTTARARWEARQAERFGSCRPRAQMTLSILNEILAQLPGAADYTLRQFRDATASMVEEGLSK
jgi:hypothetical protein